MFSIGKRSGQMARTITFAAARETVAKIVAGGYVNVDEPDQSLLVLKPLSEEDGGVVHGGGTKMRRADLLYVKLLAWSELYAQCHQSDDQGVPDPD